MMCADPYHSKSILVFGLARSGLSAIKSLVASKADVYAADDNAQALAHAQELGATPVDIKKVDFKIFDAVMISPGVPLTHPKPHPVVVKAQKANVDIIGDTEIFVRTIQEYSQTAKIVGITGTNGKSTTTALLGHVLSTCGQDAQTGGNIGNGVMSLRPPKFNTSYVLELSSYQLDLMGSHRLSAAVLLNITPDHLERHGGMDGYIAAKRRLFMNQGAGDVAVIGVDDDHCQQVCTDLIASNGRTIIPISAKRVISKGVYVLNGVLHDATGARTERIMDLRQAPSLVGPHNWQNAAAAYAVARGLGHNPANITRGLQSFQGLAHRMEVMGTHNGIRYINDSKATNIDAARQALSSMKDIFWIAGGQAKDQDFSVLHDLMGNVQKAYCIGQDGAKIAKSIKGHVETVTVKTMLDAVKAAHHDAVHHRQQSPLKTVPTVLLSPACASFDQYADFEARGDDFKHHIQTVLKTAAQAVTTE